MKLIPYCLLLLSMTSASFAQSSFTYSFEAPNSSPWPADWSGASFSDEAHHSNGWGFDNPSSATDDFTGAYMGAQNVNVIGAKYHNKSAFDVTKSSLNYTMGWNPNGQKGLVDNGQAVGNQIFQIGVFNGTPTSKAPDKPTEFPGNKIQFGANLNTNPGTTPTTVGLAVAGHDSFYLAGVELTGSGVTQAGSVDLKYFDENSVELANFGTMNYTAVDAAGTHIFNFRQDFVDDGAGGFDVTLTVDEYIVNPANNTTTYIGQTGYGTQNVKHQLGSIKELTPGLGIRVQDASGAAITAANYDGGVPVKIVPEPSSVMLTLLGSMACVLRRRR